MKDLKLYNLLITDEEGVWEKSSYDFPLDNFLKYTDENLVSILQNSENMDSLLEIPTLFGYKSNHVQLYYGKITSIVKNKYVLKINYRKLKIVKFVNYHQFDYIIRNMNIGVTEINQVAWSVKNVDIVEILNKYDLLTPILLTCTSVRGFIDQVFSLTSNSNEEIFYRGHSNKDKYKLEPSLFRKDKEGNYLYLENEDILYKELLVSNSKDFSSDECTLDKLVRMQHYSLPTRLLDITSNPLIAFYFACKSNIDADGEIICFKMRRDNIKYFDSDTASCIANLARLPYSEKEKIDFKVSQFNEQDAIKRLIHFIKEEKSFFQPNIIPEDLSKIICVKSKKNNSRIASQCGAFLMFGHEAVLHENNLDITRIVIKNKDKNKQRILKELDALNINDSTVFPNIENSAKHIADKYKNKGLHN